MTKMEPYTPEEEQVLQWLQDQESKEIFQAMRAFWAHGDTAALTNFCLELYRHHSGEDLLERLSGCGQVVLFGAGGNGRALLWALKSTGIEVACFGDNALNKQNAEHYGLPVWSAQVMRERYPEAIVVITPTTIPDTQKIATQLIGLGYRPDQLFIPAEGFGEQYFDFDRFTWGDQEVMVDGGSLGGADCLRFIELCKGQYRRILAFEPDHTNRAQCEANLAGCADCTVYPYGLWDREETLSFTSNLGCSHITDQGTDTVQVRALDELLQGEPITFLKMDIEGSELRALQGAAHAIRTHKPKLAICVYHLPEDLTTIPIYLKELVPDYNFVLRHYAIGPVETVLYGYIE